MVSILSIALVLSYSAFGIDSGKLAEFLYIIIHLLVADNRKHLVTLKSYFFVFVKKCQFILTGSTVTDDDEIMHTGTGRITNMAMYPMSLFESLESNGNISLRRLFNEPDYNIEGEMFQLSIKQLIFVACRGDWTASLDDMSVNVKYLIAKDYVEEICNKGISQVDKTRRNPTLARVILRSYARNIFTNPKRLPKSRKRI